MNALAVPDPKADPGNAESSVATPGDDRAGRCPTGRRARAIALYLPQFHPIPENDAWWGKGFTEWTNTAKAKPLFRGHYQPHVPADLGFYDLRVPEVREAQADLARAAGIEAFCYYHYWFAGRRILERPFIEVLASGRPGFPFCLCWANESWSGVWHGDPKRILIEQTYPGATDDRAHFTTLLPAFADPRYLRVDGKPLLLIYKPGDLPDSRATLGVWRELAARAGLRGLYVAGMTARADWDAASAGFDASAVAPLINRNPWISRRRPLAWLRRRWSILRGLPMRYSWDDMMRGWVGVLHAHFAAAAQKWDVHPCVVHAWDNTPRSGANGVVLTGASPAQFRTWLDAILATARDLPAERRIVLLKSWNEWAEGNHLEPDLRSGRAYLEAVLEVTTRGDASTKPDQNQSLEPSDNERPQKKVACIARTRTAT